MIKDNKVEPGEIDPEELRRQMRLTPNVVNCDNEWLEPIGGCIGHVSEVNGLGGEEVTTFVPTRHELEQLFLYWARRKVDLDFFMFTWATAGSDWCRVSSFAARRMGRIMPLLGRDACIPLWEAVEAEFANQSPELWRAFQEDDCATRDRLLEEAYRLADEGRCHGAATPDE